MRIRIILTFIVAAMLMSNMPVSAFSGDDVYATGELSVNNMIVDAKDNVYFCEGNTAVWISLRGTFEALGATVTWDKDSNAISILYDNRLYKCEIQAPNSHYPENKYISITDTASEKRIRLNGMGYAGAFKDIDGHIFLAKGTMAQFLRCIGLKMNIDSENNVVDIAAY